MARMLGQAIIDNGLDLVYGGADVGLMGEVADTVLGGNRAVIRYHTQIICAQSISPGVDRIARC